MRRATAIAAPLGLVGFLVACDENRTDERMEVFEQCVVDGGGSVAGDWSLVFDEFGNAIAILGGTADVDPDVLQTCLELASLPLES